ncbi:MAG: PQQ-dependent sugar dehydrogenase [Acidobacteriota bacterium]
MSKFQKLLYLIGFLPLLAVSAACQNNGASALPNVINVDEPKKFEYKPGDLPPPFQTNSAFRASKIVPQPANAALTIPKGFRINVFAEGGFNQPRWMALAPNGDVFLSDARANTVYVLRDKDKDGVAEERFVFSDKLDQPFGIAFHKDWVYIANTSAVVRFKYKSGQTQADGEPEKLIELTRGGYNQHWTRNVLFSPNGEKMYVSIGSSGNYQPEDDAKRAAISEYNPDGTGHRIYASGLRNPIGLAWNPVTKELWTAVNERDGLGDDLVPDFVTSVKDGGFYGYPYYYIGENKETRLKDVDYTKLAKVTVPDVLLTSHSAALGIVFNDGNMFPKEFENDAFVALHGSWNRQKLTGYKVIRVKMKDGKPVGGYDDFVSGWLPTEDSNEVWGRPVGLLMNADGSLLICDDGADKIWRVSYQK